MRVSTVKAPPEQACRSCGCTESRACRGGCAWASARLCTTCAGGRRFVLGVDPSITSCGWGIVRARNLTRVTSGTWHPSKAAGAEDRFDQLAAAILWLIDENDVTDVVVETPSGGQRGQRSATQLMVYARAIGVCEAAARLSGARVHRMTVNEWKGTSKKSLTYATVGRLLGRAAGTDDESDALGIALAFCGRIEL